MKPTVEIEEVTEQKSNDSIFYKLLVLSGLSLFLVRVLVKKNQQDHTHQKLHAIPQHRLILPDSPQKTEDNDENVQISTKPLKKKKIEFRNRRTPNDMAAPKIFKEKIEKGIKAHPVLL